MSRIQRVSTLIVASAFLSVSCVVQAAPSSLSPSGSAVSDGLSVTYDPGSGRLIADSADGSSLTAFELRSVTESFLGGCDGLGGPFDVCSDSKIFKLDTNGFDGVDLGMTLPANLSGDALLADLRVDGATLGGDFDVGSGIYLVHPDFLVPEPMSGTMLGLGVVLLGATWRRRTGRARQGR